jgi:predicted xylose isomerase-like sugar epimerase
VESETTYEIFKKQADNTTVLVEAVKGIEEAQKRVKELTGQGTDEYFVFDPVKANVIEPSEPAVVIDPFAP